MSKYGRILKIWRKSKGLSIEKLVKLSGVDKNGISAIERNAREPKESTLEKLCSALGKELKDLYAEGAKESPPGKKLIGQNAYICNNPEHKVLHEWLDELLDSSPDVRSGIVANIALMRTAVKCGQSSLPDELKKFSSEATDSDKATFSVKR